MKFALEEQYFAVEKWIDGLALIGRVYKYMREGEESCTITIAFCPFCGEDIPEADSLKTA